MTEMNEQELRRLASGSANPVNLSAVVKYVTTTQAGPTFRFGSSGTRLDVTKLELTVKVASDTKVVDIEGAVDITGLVLALSGGDGDGFLSSVLPTEPIEMRGDVGIDISLRKGWRSLLGRSRFPLTLSVSPLALNRGRTRCRDGR